MRRRTVLMSLGLAPSMVRTGAAAAAQPATAKPAAGFVTDAAGRRFAPIASPGARESQSVGRDTIDVNVGAPQQALLGFGAAFTEAACTVMAAMPADGRAALLRELYGPAGLNLSTARACIGASDYATHLFSYDEGAPDPELARFSIAPDRPAVIPVLKALRAARPDLFLFASPWSPPGWMKYGGSMKGGSIRPENLAVYARYIGKYLDAYAAEGLPVQAVTVQNEIDADQGGRMPAAAWPQETDTLYMSEHLGPELARRGGRTQLWMLDHNYDLAGRVMDQLAKPAVAKVVDAVAWHGYVGEPEAMSRVHAAFPTKGAHWTEGGAMVDDADFLTGWTKWAQTIAGVLNNQAQSFTVWNAALDEHGRPNIGPFTCGGLVTVRSGDHAVVRTGLYYALGHYARVLKRGDRVLKTRTRGDGLTAVAARGPDGLKLVLANAGPARNATVTAGARREAVALAADSVTTLTWAA